MNLFEFHFNETLWYIFLIFFGSVTIFFTSTGYKYEKKTVIKSYLISAVLLVLTMTTIFGIEETSIKSGILFGDFIRFLIFLLLFAIVVCIFIFLLLCTQKEFRDRIIKKISKFWKRRND